MANINDKKIKDNKKIENKNAEGNNKLSKIHIHPLSPEDSKLIKGGTSGWGGGGGGWG